MAKGRYSAGMTQLSRPTVPPPFGDQLRTWRRQRRVSQLDLALEIEMSQRHLSFIESGRTRPSRALVIRLAEGLDVPLRDRNQMLLAAGYAPVYGERALDDPALASARAAIELILTGHAPFPALAVDQRWTLISANRALAPFLALVADKSLLAPPINVLRLSLHPQGLAPHILNLGEWAAHLLDRLRRQIATRADADLKTLLSELTGLCPLDASPRGPDYGGVLVPLRLQTPVGPLALFSTTTVFGTPTDITLSELMLEAFYPADAETDARLRQWVG
ncbi:helix-turn-helix domain-containing protein [Elstera litoralis]|nr:helix-turn-helix transcriptional regulator [Elstera litoralis]